MIAPKQITAQLVDTVVLNDKYTQFMFELVEPPSQPFEAGQYVSIKVAETGERRSYSICSSPATPHRFELLIDTAPDGLGCRYLKNLKIGDRVSALMPLGQFILPQDEHEAHIMMIATGSGVTPFRSMLFEHFQLRQDPRPVTLYWGMREVDQLFWVEEFEQLAHAFPRFNFHPVISRAVPEWTLCRGRVTDCLETHPFPQQAGFYLCGNAAMIGDVITFLQKKGVSPSAIHHEKFY